MIHLNGGRELLAEGFETNHCLVLLFQELERKNYKLDSFGVFIERAKTFEAFWIFS